MKLSLKVDSALHQGYWIYKTRLHSPHHSQVSMEATHCHDDISLKAFTFYERKCKLLLIHNIDIYFENKVTRMSSTAVYRENYSPPPH